MQTSEFTDTEIQAWFEQCDKTGKGIYVVYQNFSDIDTADITIETYADLSENMKDGTAFLIYNNSQAFESSATYIKGGWFKKSSIRFEIQDETESELKKSVSYYCVDSQEVLLNSITDKDGNKLEYTAMTAEEAGIGNLYSYYEATAFSTICTSLYVEIPEKIQNIAEISSTAYLNGEAVNTQYTTNANGSNISGTVSFMFYNYETDFDEISFAITDENGKTVFESEKFKVEEDDEAFYFTMGSNKKGKLVIVADE